MPFGRGGDRLCPRGDLRARIEKFKGLGAIFSPVSVMKVLIQLLLGLEVIHRHHILHRHIKIGDFGCSKELDRTDGMTSTKIGTPLCEAPEVMSGRKYGVGADMWALGVLLYELCTLKRPFYGSNLHELHKNIESGRFEPIPAENCPAEARERRRNLSALLNVDPTKRPSASDLLKLSFIRKYAERLELLPFFPPGEV